MATIITTTDFYNDVCNDMSKEVAKYTPQLFFNKNLSITNPPSADSSSILLTVNGRFFLITSGHTVHGININCLGFMIEDYFYTIGGYLRYFDPNDVDRHEPNKIDIAIFELEEKTINALKEKYDFVQWNKVSFNHSSSESSHYLIFGYPNQKTRKHFPTKEILPSPFFFRTNGVSIKHYLKENTNSNTTLIINVNQKYVMGSETKSIEQLPELGGISGCGVWEILNLYGEKPQYKLVSIVTGENEQQTCLYSSKIDNVRSILKTQFNLNLI